MTIVADIREVPSGVPDILKRLNVEVVMAQLTHGDYWVGNIPTERKEAHDYVGSMIDGRLNNQLSELSYSYDMSFLIVEGNVTEALMESSIPREAYLSSLVGSAVKVAPDGKQGLINVLCVDTKWDTALLLKKLDEKLSTGDTYRLPRMERRPMTDGDILAYVLSSFPAIGETRARNLLKKFDGFDALLAASKDELSEAEDIGPKTAERFYHDLHRKVNSP